ncbi:protein amalgam-like [Littorina saxatilis]|uniref:protein amalgam-like n=1 Tax=Littorina saxatilis TaxID=31220 RepID=UPI0038B5E6A5
MHINTTHTVNMTTAVPTFQLICLAADVYPEPNYSWHNVTCDNGYNHNTCTFTPGPEEHYTHPICTAERPDIPPYGKKIAKYESPPLKLTYEAKVAAMTINAAEGTFTVNGEDYANLSLVCTAHGRPLPTELKVTKLGNDDFTITTTTIEKGNWSVEAAVTLSDIQCRDMGTYSCTAHNGVGQPDTESIMLNVRCKT